MHETRLGKISHVYCGFGGYQDAQLGYGFVIEGEGWGVTTPFEGHWRIERTNHAQWTEEDRINALGQAFLKLGNILRDAKKTDVSQLVGTPVEATFENNQLVTWRVLKEIL